MLTCSRPTAIFPEPHANKLCPYRLRKRTARNLSALAHEQFKVVMFVGANQTKIAFDAADALQRLGDRGSYIKISGCGHNALDFPISYYIGQWAAQDPTAYFHVISKDTGFDPLLSHLKTKGIFAARHVAVADIPLLKATGLKSVGERAGFIAAKLQNLGQAKPRAVKTLSSTIRALFQKQFGEKEIADVMQTLQTGGIISINGNKIAYPTFDKDGPPK